MCAHKDCAPLYFTLPTFVIHDRTKWLHDLKVINTSLNCDHRNYRIQNPSLFRKENKIEKLSWKMNLDNEFKKKLSTILTYTKI